MRVPGPARQPVRSLDATRRPPLRRTARGAHHGRVAFDRSINADPTTPFFAFSMSKAFTGVCIHRLLEDGRLEWDAPVAEFWPEFGCKGKQTATIRHVFLHQTGIPGAHLYFQS